MHPDDLAFHISQLERLIAPARSHYHQLVMLAGGTWEARTEILREFAQKIDLRYFALGRPLSARLLNEPEEKAPFVIRRFLDEILDETPQTVLVLDHLEILFAKRLKIDPLQVLKDLSRAKVVVAAWPGTVRGGIFSYAEAHHPEHYERQEPDILDYLL